MTAETQSARYVMGKAEQTSLFLVIILQFVSTAVTNMLIPVYGDITKYFHVDESMQGVPDSIFILIMAVLSVFWGYYTDRVSRSKIIMFGAFIGLVGTAATAFNTFQSPFGFQMLIFSRAFTAVGLGCVLPVGYSILADLVPEDQRSGWFGTMAILNSISNGIGQGMSSFLSSLTIWGWRFPFLIISIVSVIIICFLFFIKLPERGTHEKELASLQEYDISYAYQLSKKDIVQILKKKTNRNVFIQGFFSIIPGTLVVYFLTALFSSTNGVLGSLPDSIRTPVSSIMAALVGIGYLVGNSVLAGLGDTLYKKDPRNRVRLAAVSLCISVPTCIVFMIMAGRLTPDGVLTEDASIIDALELIFNSHPTEFTLYFIFAFIGSFFSAAPVALRGAILIDVNLPEHRGTTVSVFNLSEMLGKGLTLALSPVLLSFFANALPNFYPHQMMIIFAALFWIPAAIIWVRTINPVREDMLEKTMILKERTQMTFIDYIFELEILLDEGIQKVYDASKLLNRDLKQSMVNINKSIKIFKGIDSRARTDDMTDLKSRAHNLLLKAIMLKTELKNIINLKKNSENGDVSDDIEQLRKKIDEWWDKSDIGKIEVLYESAILKIIEARLNRKYNLFRTINTLQESLEIFDRVERLARERLLDEDIRKLNEEEKEFQDRVKGIIAKAQSTKYNTYNLKENLELLIRDMKQVGVDGEDLKKIISLAREYYVPYTEIFEETVETRKAKRELRLISNKIEELFEKYDEINK